MSTNATCSMDPPAHRICTRGLLASVEGNNGMGKTYLMNRVVETLDDKPLILDGFSQRKDGRYGLGELLLRALRKASAGDPFLRGGSPMAEALILLAIKRDDLDSVAAELSTGRTVVEGRCVDTTAVCHGLLTHPDDLDAALDSAIDLLRLAARFRPLPDLTILVTDDVAASIERAQRRDQSVFTDEQVWFMRETNVLHERLAAADPARYRVVDRRHLDEDEATELIRAWITETRTDLTCVREPWLGPDSRCMYCGQFPELTSA
ncbi:MAG TPA: hypothetical protein VL551_11570 [Actinospica sp.]|nr:hypothetical protein [Actinospica sp.]